MQIAVTGAEGMLGTDLVALARMQGHEVIEYIHPAFDITREADVQRCPEDADILINCAAYTNVEKASSERQTAMEVNAFGAQKLARAARNAGVPLIHISTDFVFDGKKKAPYTEEDLPNPLNVYGESKLLGEQLVRQVCPQSVILRIEWTYGSGGTNFIRKVLARACEGQPLRIVSDQIGSPTWTRDVAGALLRIAEDFCPGTYHYAGEGSVSRFELAGFVLEQKKINAHLVPCTSDEFPSAAKRPLNSRFDCAKIRETFGIQNRPWQESLAEFLEAYP